MIQKQLYELTPADLEEFAIWVFPHGEDNDDDEIDEETVHGVNLNNFSFDRAFLCKAKFALADGREYIGIVRPANSLGDSEPWFFVNETTAAYFWFGIVKPEKDELDRLYELMGGRDSKIFPIRWFAPGLPSEYPSEGTIDGFAYTENLEEVIYVH